MLDHGITTETKPADIEWKQIRRWLWNYGHLQGCCERDVDKITRDYHPLVRSALASIQGLDANMDVLALKCHGRECEPDGILGPATRELLTLPRCGYPDIPVDPLGQQRGGMGPAFPREITAVRGFSTGSGSWPAPGCDPEAKFPELHSTVLWLNPSGSPYSREDLQAAVDIAIACMFDAGMQLRVDITTSAPAAWTHKLVFARTTGSTIGWFYIYQSGSGCTQLNGVLSNRYAPSNLTLYASLIVHESHGHGIGLGHSRGGIMNPSILLVDPLTYRSGPSWPTVRRYFGGEAIPLEPGPGPGPGPDPPPDPDPDPDPPDPRLPWQKVLEIILSILRNCPDPAERPRAVLQPINATRELVIRRALRKEYLDQGGTIQDWRRKRKGIMESVRAYHSRMTEAERAAVLEAANELPEDPF